MTRAVVHSNPGLVDTAAFTTFGVNAKPNAASPIGYFGTGLKYAIATLVRAGCIVTVWIGEEPHEFFAKKQDFRGKELLRLSMRRKRGATARWTATELPFTTELGKNWELWMALRELHSNALDEGGESYLSIGDAVGGLAGTTRIVVEGEQYVEAYRRLDEVFLRGYDKAGEGAVQVLKGRASGHGYYRGLRAMDLPRASLHTWCVRAPCDLTEDRTLKHGFMLGYYAAKHVMASDDEDLITSVLRAADDTWEATLAFSPDELASATFLRLAVIYSKNRTVYRVVERNAPKTEAAAADWRLTLAQALKRGDREAVAQLTWEHAARLALMLRADYEAEPAPVEPEAGEVPVPF